LGVRKKCDYFVEGRKRGGRGGAAPSFFPAFRAEYTYLPICFDSAQVLYIYLIKVIT